jgi:hypothetical protein
LKPNEKKLNFMERLDQGHPHPSIKHPETEISLYQRAIATVYAVYY